MDDLSVFLIGGVIALFIKNFNIKNFTKEQMGGNINEIHLENLNPGNQKARKFKAQILEKEGKFDSDKYFKALANPNNDEWLPIEQFMKNTYIPNFKLQKLMDESIVISIDEVMAEFKKRNLDYTLTALHVTSALSTKEASEPTQDEIIERYNKIKADDYKHSELRNLSYVSWEKKPF